VQLISIRVLHLPNSCCMTDRAAAADSTKQQQGTLELSRMEMWGLVGAVAEGVQQRHSSGAAARR
jgi:hypothetical protein